MPITVEKKKKMNICTASAPLQPSHATDYWCNVQLQSLTCTLHTIAPKAKLSGTSFPLFFSFFLPLNANLPAKIQPNFHTCEVITFKGDHQKFSNNAAASLLWQWEYLRRIQRTTTDSSNSRQYHQLHTNFFTTLFSFGYDSLNKIPKYCKTFTLYLNIYLNIFKNKIEISWPLTYKNKHYGWKWASKEPSSTLHPISFIVLSFKIYTDSLVIHSVLKSII